MLSLPSGRTRWTSKKAVITGSEDVKLKEFSQAEELSGKLAFQQLEDKLMHSVLENDKKVIDTGKLISDVINQGMSSFTPDLMFEQLVKNYTIAKQIYGESIIRLVSGYEPDYVKKNIGIPEFQRELKENIQQKIDELKQEGMLNRDDSLSEKGIELASLVLYFEELDKIVPKGIVGEKISKKTFIRFIIGLIFLRIILLFLMMNNVPFTDIQSDWRPNFGGSYWPDEEVFFNLAKSMADFKPIMSIIYIGYAIFLAPFIYFVGATGPEMIAQTMVIVQGIILFSAALILIVFIGEKFFKNKMLPNTF